ncbi:MAG: 23S rRNA (guanosine(2251)-2'-O)-methyltransferase RlmB [Bifidobacteriaceae bacterium]|jgi:23S rRNA (guanosine2251-2'-O)-methyltransferase|nr:23S rRNA (guanosine(2251)-2'-O)-methyltransferase RlmB [Bifidobacteriaceae bacterium]
MPGNSSRRGAVRRPGSKKGPTKGSGGKNRRSLEGRGPTPKAENRPYHPAAKRKAAQDQAKRSAEKRAAAGKKAAADYVIGRNSVLEALRAKVPATRLDVADGIERDERVREALKLAAEQGVPVAGLSKRELDQRTAGTAHQGIALRVAPYEYASPLELFRLAGESPTPPLIVALDQVTDPHNLGAVLRSAAAFGAHGVVIPERRSAQMGATAWKVSAGAAARVPVARATNLVAALQTFKQAGAFVVGLDAAGEHDAARLDLATGPLVVVIGSEGQGLKRLTREACDQLAAIPIDSGTESLNAAVAGGIVLYEIAKQRRQAGPPSRL